MYKSGTPVVPASEIAVERANAFVEKAIRENWYKGLTPVVTDQMVDPAYMAALSGNRPPIAIIEFKKST